ncbi:MAG TPA: TetR/AcrR family transcriptional regulator [Solirubrobacteraceae bacterium]
MQRSRVLVATVGVTAERGYVAASVAAISQRAGVSRRTFYELFENREECFIAVLKDLETRIERAAVAASAEIGNGSWRERVRAGLWAVLCLFDSEPALANVCLLESQRGGQLVLEERERILRRLTRIVDAGRDESRDGGGAGTLTAEATVGACLAVLQARVLTRQGRGTVREPQLRELLGELMALIVLPYLGAASARRERSRPAPRSVDRAQEDTEAIDTDGRLGELPIRLTYRTARVLQAVDELADAGFSPSNREVGERAGVRDAGQVSKLLARLQMHGLVENSVTDAPVRGERNRWALTSLGRRLTGVISAYTTTRQEGA